MNLNPPKNLSFQVKSSFLVKSEIPESKKICSSVINAVCQAAFAVANIFKHTDNNHYIRLFDDLAGDTQVDLPTTTGTDRFLNFDGCSYSFIS